MYSEERAAQFRDPLRFIVLNGKGNWAIENYKKDRKNCYDFLDRSFNPNKTRRIRQKRTRQFLDNFLTIDFFFLLQIIVSYWHFNDQ